MGMYDTVRSSYDLGPGFRKDLQTKDLECCMCEYWISPTGQLFWIDYSGTQDFVDVPEEERNSPWHLFKSVPNGTHGRVMPITNLFKVVEIYPAVWDCHYSPFPRLKIYFDGGIIQKVKSLETDVNSLL